MVDVDWLGNSLPCCPFQDKEDNAKNHSLRSWNCKLRCRITGGQFRARLGASNFVTVLGGCSALEVVDPRNYSRSPYLWPRGGALGDAAVHGYVFGVVLTKLKHRQAGYGYGGTQDPFER